MVLGGQDCAKSDKLKLHTMKVKTPEGTLTVPKFELISTHSFSYLRNLVHKNKTVGRK